METIPPATIRTFTPWADYADGQWRRHEQGIDFTSAPATHAIACRAFARRRGWTAQAKVDGEFVSFTITKEPRTVQQLPAEPPASAKATQAPLHPVLITRILDRAVQVIETYARENYPDGEFQAGMLRAANLIRPIADLPSTDPVR